MYQKQSRGWIKHLDFILLDLASLYIAYIFAFYIRHQAFVPLHNQLYWSMFFVFFFIQFAVSVFGESFKNVLKRGYYREITATFRHVVWVILLATFYLFVIKEGTQYSRSTMLMTGIFYMGISYFARISWKEHLFKGGFFDVKNRSLLILTSKELLEHVISDIKQNNYGRYQIAGIALVDCTDLRKMVDGIEIVAGEENYIDYIRREWVDEVLITLPKENPYPEKIVETILSMGITTHVKLFEETEFKVQKQVIERIGNYIVLTNSINMATFRQVIYKRCLDILGGIAGCFCTILFSIIIGPIIYVQSPGPIFFSQERVGKNGRKFRIYKFRSMYMDAEDRKKELMDQNRVKDGMMFKMDNDPRIIGGSNGIGSFIRKYSIDEFPQFWNVLKGDMSLVGTRPPTVDEWEKYDLHHRVRLAIKPGITGLWQISGRSDITDFEEVVKLDREYITNWSMGLDLRILFKTVAVVLGKDGAI